MPVLRRALIALVLAAPVAAARESLPVDDLKPAGPLTSCYEYGAPGYPLVARILKYAELSARHRLAGLASYYSGFFDGRKTANGEIYRNRKYSAAHLTLPMGCWVEIKARATGKKLRLRVNDRGPYVKKFAIDLSQAAARYLGVDRAPDRYVDIRVIALPGEDPLPEHFDFAAASYAGIEKQNVLP